MSKDHLLRLVDHVDLVQATEFTVGAAKYHYHSMRAALDRAKEGGLDKPGLQKSVNRFYYHFRGFFWELYASFDTLLQATNRALDLGIKPREVQWSALHRALSQANDHGELLNHLNACFSSDWFQEVVAFRNVSHLGTLPSEGFAVGSDPPGGPKGDPTFAGLSIPGIGEPIAFCRTRGELMEKCVREALELLGQASSKGEM